MDHQLDATRAALLALDFQNYGVHPQGYWATHGEPDWRPSPVPRWTTRPGCWRPPDAIASWSSMWGWRGGRVARR